MGTIAQDFTTGAQVVYNGYTFSPAMELLRVEHKPIYDQARRTVTHTVTTLRILDIIQTSDQTDDDTLALRAAALGQQRGARLTALTDAAERFVEGTLRRTGRDHPA